MTRYGKSYLVENTTSDNRSRARKYMRKESGMSKDESMQLDHQLQTQFKNVGKCECKFMLGLARMYMNGELEGTIGEGDEKKTIASLVNQCLGIVTEEPYASQFDYNLNGMTAMQFIDAFVDKVETAGDADKDNLSKQDFGGNNGYDIVLIDSFEKAKEYAQYTDWCVTESMNAYNNYTKGGAFYFCLKNGFEKVKKCKGNNAPLDEYGLSMIAVSIYPDGQCNTITCRWNHANGGNDNVMTTEELSKVIGENFYGVFKPIKRTIVIDGKECVVGFTENGCCILYDELGNNVLGDAVVVDGEMFKVFGCDILKVEKRLCKNYLIVQDGKAQYLCDEWVDNCLYISKFSEDIGVPCFFCEKKDKKNFAIFRDGKTRYLFDEWFDMSWGENDLSKHFGAPCFWVRDNNKFNYAIIRDGKAQYLFDEWFDGFGKLTNAVKNYIIQRNEGHLRYLSNIITEMAIRKLR